MQQGIHKGQLFVASCLALLVTSLSFGIRAGLLNQWATEFNLSASELGTIAATAFWGFPLAVIIGGMVAGCDRNEKTSCICLFVSCLQVLTIFC